MGSGKHSLKQELAFIQKGESLKKEYNRNPLSNRYPMQSMDAGKEFAGLEECVGEDAVLKQKRPEDRNALAVVDRTMRMRMRPHAVGKTAF